MPNLSEFFSTRQGRISVVSAILLAVAVSIYSVTTFFGASDAERLSRQGLFVDAATGKPFHYEIQEGSTIPVPAPSGKNTGYPAELCYWTRDGKVRVEPFAVLLNRYVGKPGPTFCPDCGRLVVAKNPPPEPGAKPPPTESEFRERRSTSRETE